MNWYLLQLEDIRQVLFTEGKNENQHQRKNSSMDTYGHDGSDIHSTDRVCY